MSDLEHSFAKLLGKQPSDKQRQDLYRVRDALGLKTNDALWLVLMALQHYQAQYEQVPARIEAAATETLRSFQRAAETSANAVAAEARRELAVAVSVAARDVAEHVEARQKLQWLLSTVVACALSLGGLGWLMHTKGVDAGYGLGYVSGYQVARDEKAAAAWGASPEGRAAYRLAQAGSILQIAQCAAPGWYVKDGACFPARSAKGLYGWRIEPR